MLGKRLLRGSGSGGSAPLYVAGFETNPPFIRLGLACFPNTLEELAELLGLLGLGTLEFPWFPKKFHELPVPLESLLEALTG